MKTQGSHVQLLEGLMDDADLALYKPEVVMANHRAELEVNG